MFGIDGSEFLIIIVVALVVVGPKDLPKMMRTVGQWAGRARSMADQFRRSFDDMARQSELDELRKEVNKLKNDTVAIADAEVKSALYDSGLPDNPLSNIEDVGAAPPKLEEPAAPVAEGSPEAPPAVDTSAKLAETATGTGG